jgi:hypothetical protein
LKKVTTRGALHPGSLPRVGATATQMTVSKAADYQVLTYIPDWSSAERMNACSRNSGLQYGGDGNFTFGGGRLSGTGDVVVPVKAPPGCKIVKLFACVLGGTGTTPSHDRYLEVHLGPAGKSQLTNRTTDCMPWGTKPETKVNQWQNNTNGSATFDPCAEGEVKVVVRNGLCLGVRIFVGYVQDNAEPVSGRLVVTHGFDRQTVSNEIPVADLAKGPVSYPVPNGAKRNQFIKMEVK